MEGIFTCEELTHVWKGHSRVGPTSACGRDNHVWDLLMCGRGIHV